MAENEVDQLSYYDYMQIVTRISQMNSDGDVGKDES